MVESSIRSTGLSSAIRIDSRMGMSGDHEQLFEIRHRQDLTHVAIAVEQADVRLVATGVIAQQEQHAQRRTIHVSGALQIDHITLRIPVLTLVSITEGLMRIDVEASIGIASRRERVCQYE